MSSLDACLTAGRPAPPSGQVRASCTSVFSGELGARATARSLSRVIQSSTATACCGHREPDQVFVSSGKTNVHLFFEPHAKYFTAAGTVPCIFVPASIGWGMRPKGALCRGVARRLADTFENCAALLIRALRVRCRTTKMVATLNCKAIVFLLHGQSPDCDELERGGR